MGLVEDFMDANIVAGMASDGTDLQLAQELPNFEQIFGIAPNAEGPQVSTPTIETPGMNTPGGMA